LELAATLAWLGANLLRQQKYAEAETEIAASLAIRAQRIPDDWITGSTRSMLGGVILARARALQAAGDEQAGAELARAEPLLRAGYEAMKSRQERLPPAYRARVTEALERLVEFYSVTGDQDQADTWRMELDAWKQRPANESSAPPAAGQAGQQTSPQPETPAGRLP
jgi:hypothetical protein